MSSGSRPVLITKADEMNDAWCISSGLEDISFVQLKRFCGKRFSVEEMFRDLKDLRFGMELSWTRVKSPEQRDRMFLLAALARAHLTVLGEERENIGMQRQLQAKTQRTRVYSLFRQGAIWYRIPIAALVIVPPVALASDSTRLACWSSPNMAAVKEWIWSVFMAVASRGEARQHPDRG